MKPKNMRLMLNCETNTKLNPATNPPGWRVQPQPSVQAALTLLKSRVGQLDIDPDLFERSDLHVYVSAGAIPKDGPSAGIKTVVLPAKNKKDFDDIPESVREQLSFVWLEKVDDALEADLTTC